ncbi:methyltransferase domain-containing protein [Desulfosoma caldarium]|uniref:Methyltransferase family protein n=1 Tax=Desulfosoma caldarium TaxID=610254 RepID=A0A3N1VPR4_9BACT|nr:methyltransferase domain-containing protein [Desulfosoma caldarium]ROR03041.1 methyltransferase family protein [Desulfosoma caldarium]
MVESTQNIKNYIRDAYRRLYSNGTSRDLPIVQGKDLACALGYDPCLTRLVPEALWARFFPCGNPVPWIAFEGQRAPKILNLGSGVGLDAFFVVLGMAMRDGTVVNVDIAHEALTCGKSLMEAALAAHGPRAHIFWVQADADAIPFSDAVFDLVLMNGVFNLFECKDLLLKEVFRVLKNRGTLLLADLVRTGPLPQEWGSAMEGWLWCVNGSMEEQELFDILHTTGFAGAEILRKDCEVDPLWRAIVRARKIS